MVAGAGGGGHYYRGSPISAAAGGLIGYNGTYDQQGVNGYAPAIGGTQNLGGRGGFPTDYVYPAGIAGTFGSAGNSNSNYGSGGGSGYYGGGGGSYNSAVVGNGAGGSSYISGHTGAVAITSASNQTPKASCETGTTNNDCSIHYSDYYFTDTLMIDGNGYNWSNVKGSLLAMPNPSGDIMLLEQVMREMDGLQYHMLIKKTIPYQF